jgi:hypothetical protein
MNEDIEVMVGLGLQQPLLNMFMFFGRVTDVNLRAIRPNELSEASAMVTVVPKMTVGCCGSTVRGAVTVTVVCLLRRRDLRHWGDSTARVTFLDIRFTDPWLPVGSWATKQYLPGHLVPHKMEVRPQAASAASQSYVLLAA